MKKAPEAFRTISEVAELLDTPAHVLRFWESKFYQIRPVKRAGGRRYYRPDDVSLIAGIKVLLQEQGLTIRGVQRVLHEQGVRHVLGLAPPLDFERLAAVEPQDEAIHDETVGDTPESVGSDDVTNEAPAIESPALAVLDSDPADLPPETDPVMADAEDAPMDRDGVQQPAEILADDPAGSGAEEADSPADAVQVPAFARAAPTPAIPDPMTPAPATFERNRKPAMTQSDDLFSAAAPREPRVPLDLVVDMLPSDGDTGASRDIRIATALRATPRGSLGAKRADQARTLARRIDALLERMSEASGAGRW